MTVGTRAVGQHGGCTRQNDVIREDVPVVASGIQLLRCDRRIFDPLGDGVFVGELAKPREDLFLRGRLGHFGHQPASGFDQIDGFRRIQGLEHVFHVIDQSCPQVITFLGAPQSARTPAALERAPVTEHRVAPIGATLGEVVKVAQHLAMGCLKMIGLVEGFERDLPVAGDYRRLAPVVAQAFPPERVEKRPGGAERLVQALAVGIHVDVDPTGPATDLHSLQRNVLILQCVPPVLAVDYIHAPALQIELPAVEFAVEAGAVAAAVGQAPAAVRAHIVESLDLIRTGSNDDDGIIDDVVRIEVADLRDILFPAGHLPYAGPQALVLQLRIVGREV